MIKKLSLRITLNEEDKITGLYFVPMYSSEPLPEYLDQNLITEKDIKLTSNEFEVEGKHTSPKSKKLGYAVILVHGSGPQDMDVSIGPNKFFRDLAYGLSNVGFDVIRYNKRTFQYANKMPINILDLGLEFEFIDDAVSAVKYLQKEGFESDKIIIIGHSQSGSILSGIESKLLKDKIDIKAYIMMAATPVSLEVKILEQTKFISNLDGLISEEEKNQIKIFESYVEELKDLNSLDPNNLPFGLNIKYWKDMKENFSPMMMVNIEKPIFVLQGGKDYQVTKQDFDKWKEIFKNKKNVEYQYLRKLNHIFFETTVDPSPQNYQIPGFISEDVIDVISDWIQTLTKVQ